MQNNENIIKINEQEKTETFLSAKKEHKTFALFNQQQSFFWLNGKLLPLRDYVVSRRRVLFCYIFNKSISNE